MATRYTWDSVTGRFILDDSGLYVVDNYGTYILADQISVSTDLPDYAPGSTATFTANVVAGDTVTFNVVDTTGAAVSGTNQPWTVTDGGVGDLDGVANGVIQTTWAVGQDAAGESFVLTATDVSTGGTSSATFTDAINGVAIDVTGQDSTAVANGAVFSNVTSTVSTGTGVFQSFLVVQKNGIESGFNTDGSPLPLDDKETAHTNAILLNDVPLVAGSAANGGTIGVNYREFRIDINQSGAANQPQLISLDQLKLYEASTGTLTSLTGLTAVYDLDAGGDKTVLLDAEWNAGSGKGDYVVLIPDSVFTHNAATPYLYLYTEFGGGTTGSDVNKYAANSGFEEWGVISATAPPTPTAVISGVKYVDANGNGVLNVPDDVPKAGVQIDLFQDNGSVAGHLDAGDTFVSSVLTDASGAYSFGPLDAGNYLILEGTQAGWIESPQVGTTLVNPIDGVHDDLSQYGYAITVGTTNQTGFNFANFQQFSISGTKYTDVNGLDNQTAIGADDTVLGGITIDLFNHDSGTNTNTLVTTQVTAADGSYSFTGLGPLAAGHSYFVQEEKPAGDTETFGSAGYTVAATSGNTKTGDNFANFVNFSISGTKYTDVNGLDNQTAIGADDTVLGGITIDLFNHDSGTNTNTLVTTQVTAADGSYSFTGLGPLAAGHSYFVQEETPSGDVETFGSAGYTVAATSGNTTTGDNFANFHFNPAAELTQGYWANHLQAWDGLAGTGKTTSANDVPHDVNPLTNGLLLGDINHNGVADPGEHTLFIDLAAAQKIEAGATSGDDRLIMLAQAVATQLNIYNDWYKYGTDNLEPHNVIWEAVDWLKATGGVLGDGALTGQGTVTKSTGAVTGGDWGTIGNNQFYLGPGTANSWGPDQTFGGVSGINGEDIKNALMWFNQSQLVVTKDGGSVAWNNAGTFENYQTNDLDKFWLTLSAEHLV